MTALIRGQYVIPRLTYATCIQNGRHSLQPFRRRLRASKLKMCHATLTTAILGVVCQAKLRKLGLHMVYLCAEFDYSSFSCSRHIIGALKFKIGHVTLTTLILRVICHPCIC